VGSIWFIIEKLVKIQVAKWGTSKKFKKRERERERGNINKVKL